MARRKKELDDHGMPLWLVGLIFLGPLLLGVPLLAGLFGRSNAESCARHESELRASLGPGGRLAPGDHHSFYYCPAGCDEGHAPSCLETATIYAAGKGYAYGGGVDFAKAADYAQRACAINGSGCALAKAYDCRANEPACADRCTFGDLGSCEVLWEAHSDNGWPRSERDALAAQPWLKAGCAMADSALCAASDRVACGLDPADCGERCQAGEARACAGLAEGFAAGKLKLRQDSGKAGGFRKKACALDAAVFPDCADILAEPELSPG